MTAPRLTGNRCQCTACLEVFNSESTFDRHRVGPFESPEAPAKRRCLTPAEMTAKGWLHNAAGFWIRSVRPAVTHALEGPCTPPGTGSAGGAL